MALNSSEKKLIDELQDGRGGAITAKKLGELIGAKDGNTSEPTRQLIKSCIETHKMPIGSCNKGYFLIDSGPELEEVIQSLKGRISGIEDRIKSLEQGWEKRENSPDKKWPK